PATAARHPPPGSLPPPSPPRTAAGGRRTAATGCKGGSAGAPHPHAQEREVRQLRRRFAIDDDRGRPRSSAGGDTDEGDGHPAHTVDDLQEALLPHDVTRHLPVQ